MPIIDLQRRMVEAGRIRAGDRGPKGEPRKIDKWRLTSRDRVRLDAASSLWGGEVREWESQWELYTETDSLPIMLLPGQLPTTWYELWSRGGCQRRCDGQHEIISDRSCLCGDERECKPYTRLPVLLPDLPGIGSWLISSTGWNAATELAGTADLLQRGSAQGVLIPARLRLEQREEVKAGQTRKYAVPVIDIDVSFRELLGITAAPERVALPSGYTPLQALTPGVSVAEGLAEAERSSSTRTARSVAPIPSVDDDIPFGDPVPVPEEPGPSPSPAAVAATPIDGPGSLKPTPGQKKKIGVFISELRDQAKVVTTEQLWANIAKARGRDVEFLILGLGGRDEGVLHFGPLLADLDRAEASRLIDWFERVAQKAGAAA